MPFTLGILHTFSFTNSQPTHIQTKRRSSGGYHQWDSLTCLYLAAFWLLLLFLASQRGEWWYSLNAALPLVVVVVAVVVVQGSPVCFTRSSEATGDARLGRKPPSPRTNRMSLATTLIARALCEQQTVSLSLTQEQSPSVTPYSLPVTVWGSQVTVRSDLSRQYVRVRYM